MIRKYLMVPAATLLSVISFIGFATAKSSQQEVVPYAANFNYTLASQAAPGSGGVTFAIGNVNYQSNSKILWFSAPQFNNLDRGIKDDLSELLIAKGFSVRGPFDSYDLIPYSDKKAIDLYLVMAVELSITYKDPKAEPGGVASWTYTGNIEVNGKIHLGLKEIVTGELMWSKSIPLTKFEFPYSIPNQRIFDYNAFPYNLVMNDVAKGIEKQYPGLMATFWKLIDPEEMGIIKKQCQELKSKKGY